MLEKTRESGVLGVCALCVVHMPTIENSFYSAAFLHSGFVP